MGGFRPSLSAVLPEIGCTSEAMMLLVLSSAPKMGMEAPRLSTKGCHMTPIIFPPMLDSSDNITMMRTLPFKTRVLWILLINLKGVYLNCPRSLQRPLHRQRAIRLTEAQTHSGHHRRGGRSGFRRMRKTRHPPTALVAMSDILAIGALDAPRKLEIRTLEDLSTAGFEDIPIASLVSPHDYSLSATTP